MDINQEESQNIAQLSEILIWQEGQQLKKRAEIIDRQEPKKTIYLTTYVEAIIAKSKAKPNEEKTYPAYLCLFRRQKEFIFGLVQKKVADKKKKKESLFLNEIKIGQLSLDFSNQLGLIILQIIKKQKRRFQIKFLTKNQFIRNRWFTLLKNLNYNLRKEWNKNQEQEMLKIKHIPVEQHLRTVEISESFRNIAIFTNFRDLAKLSNQHITPIAYQQLVFYTISAQFQHKMVQSQHLQCLLMMYSQKEQVYLAIAFSNFQYINCLPKRQHERSAVEYKLKQQKVHFQSFKLSETSWAQPSDRQINLSYGKFKHQIYCKNPKLKEKWSILMLNQKYNRGAEPQIGKTFDIFKQLSKSQTVDSVNKLLSANFPKQQHSKVNQPKQSILKQKDLKILELQQKVKKSDAEKEQLTQYVLKTIRKSSLNSHVVDPNISDIAQLSIGVISRICQRMDQDQSFAQDKSLSVIKQHLLQIKESKQSEQSSLKLKQGSYNKSSRFSAPQQIPINQQYENSLQPVLPQESEQ